MAARKTEEPIAVKTANERTGDVLVRPAKATSERRERIAGIIEADLDCNDWTAHAPLKVWKRAAGGNYEATEERVEVWAPMTRRLGKILYGMRVEAERDADGFFVAAAGGKARSIEFQVTAAFTESNPTFSATVVDFRDGEDPDPSDAGLTIENTSARYRGEVNVKGTALYDPELDRYYAIQVDCPPES